MDSQNVTSANTVIGERLARLSAVFLTIYISFLAIFAPVRESPSWVKHAPRSAAAVYLGVVAVALIWGCSRGWRLVLYLDVDGITVRNYFRTYRIGWPEVKSFTDGNAGWPMADGPAWALSVVTHDRRPVVASATTSYSGADPETLAAVREHAGRHGIATDLVGVAKKVRPRRRNFVGDLLLWLAIFVSFFYLLSLLGVNCSSC